MGKTPINTPRSTEIGTRGQFRNTQPIQISAVLSYVLYLGGLFHKVLFPEKHFRRQNMQVFGGACLVRAALSGGVTALQPLIVGQERWTQAVSIFRLTLIGIERFVHRVLYIFVSCLCVFSSI